MLIDQTFFRTSFLLDKATEVAEVSNSVAAVAGGDCSRGTRGPQHGGDGQGPGPRPLLEFYALGF